MCLQRPALAQGTRKQKSHAPHPERTPLTLTASGTDAPPAFLVNQRLPRGSAQAQAGRDGAHHTPLPHSSLEYGGHCQQGPLGNQLTPITLPQNRKAPTVPLLLHPGARATQSSALSSASQRSPGSTAGATAHPASRSGVGHWLGWPPASLTFPNRPAMLCQQAEHAPSAAPRIPNASVATQAWRDEAWARRGCKSCGREPWVCPGENKLIFAS